MKKTVISTVLACIILHAMCMPSHAATIFEKTDCENGYGGAYTVTGIEPTGCITMIFGIDCNGQPFTWNPPVVHIAEDLPDIYTHHFSGVTDGKPWFANVKLGSHGEVLKAWGQMTDGTYYMLSTTTTP